MLKDEFDIRVQEVEKYFLFLHKVEEDYKIITDYTKTKSFSIDDDLTKILKANGFLLLYNLIESTILNGVISIFDILKIEQLTYKDLSDELKMFWLNNKYKHDPEVKAPTIVRHFYNIIKDVVNSVTVEVVKSRIDHSGSLTTQHIKEIADDIGFSISMTHFRQNIHKPIFEKIAEHRNDLAHGKFSFSFIGKDYTYKGETRIIDDKEKIIKFGLVHFKDFTIEHLTIFIKSVEEYIENKSYKGVI